MKTFSFRTAPVACLLSFILSLAASAQPQSDGSYKSEEGVSTYGLVPGREESVVYDDAKALSAETVQQLNEKLIAYKDTVVSGEFMILVIKKYPGELDNYVRRVMREWKLGPKSILMLVEIEGREMKIEVGDELTSRLTAELRYRIMDNDITPHFKTGDYDAGIIAGVTSIQKVFQGTYSYPEQGYPIGVIIMLVVYGIAVVASVLALFIPKEYTTPSVALLAPFHFVFSYMTGIWWVVLAFVVVFGSLRYLVLKSKMKLLKFHIDPGKREEDSGDRMIRNQEIYNSSSSPDSNDDRSDDHGKW